MVRKYKGCVGSVRNIDAMEDKPYFATVGLDRFLRIYDIKSRRPLQKVYLKSRLNSVLLRPDFDPFQTEKERQEEAERLAREAEMDSDIEEIADVEEERDSLWKNMEEVGEGAAATAEKKKKRKAALEDEEDATAEEEHIEKPKKKRGKKKLKKVKG